MTAILHERRPTQNLDDAHSHFLSVSIRKTHILAGNEMNRLLPTLVNGNVGSVEVGPVQGIANGIQSPGQPWHMTGSLGENNRAPFRGVGA